MDFVIKDPTKGDWLGDSIQRTLGKRDKATPLLMALLERVVDLENQSRAKSVTTAAPTPTAPTQGAPSDAQAPGFTTPTEGTSQPLATKTDDAGLAEHALKCVRPEWVEDAEEELLEQRNPYPSSPRPTWGKLNWCRTCGALWSQGRILVPAVTPASSTSVKQPLSGSASGLNKGLDESRSSAWTPEQANKDGDLYCCTSHYGQVHPADKPNRCTPPHHYFALDRDWCDCGQTRVQP